MTRNDAPAGARTTELLPPVPEPLLAAMEEAGAAFDLTEAVPEPQDAPELGWGVLGPGGIASTFATDVPAYSSGRVVAVGSRDPQRARAFVEAHPAAGKGQEVRAHSSYEKLVADPEVEAVYVATPHAFHAEHALLALEAGKPVLVEKAFTRDADQARTVLEEASRRGLFAMEAMWSRFLPGHVLTRAMVAAGVLGQVRHARADFHEPLLDVPRLVRPELAGGALLDLGVYPVGLIHSILGVPPRLTAAGRLSEQGVDLDEVVTLAYPQATAVATAGMDGLSSKTAEVVGTEARLRLGGVFFAPSVLELTWRDRSRSAVTWDARVPGGFQFEAAEVARCLAGGRTQSEVMPWRVTLEVMTMLDEVRRQLGVVYPGEGR
ncbi:MAG: Gfo/Idh/MocA family oxidoreductase [Actinomyces sp.]|uniref:Gfo/Idh/MocA family protein n=1 Tax=Actinomyces sp. TaxID=29317 RepID=UPI0026DB27D8|nr:Gfo/Idh/MocA family oxidoreductase [Actinomyces sp.]MDO4243375.1 Gfo/Idh/MocA family oxidoreductase [Actinomyces sp.]